MAKLTWHTTGQNHYETGVDRVVLYPMITTGDSAGTYGTGVAWNGVTAISESPSGAEPTPIYADNIKYLTMMSAEELALSIEAYMSPEEFDECDGSAELVTGVTIGQQERKTFGLCYRTIIGNDVDKNEHGYKLHIVYGCLAAPSERAYQSVNDSPEAMTLSWEISTTPIDVANHKPTARVTIDSTKVDATKLAALEEILYGGESTQPSLPTPATIVSTLSAT